MTLASVLVELGAHPVRTIVLRWNWKSAACSATTRGLVFFAVNLGAGPVAGARALLTEFCLRGATAGFYGAITQALSTAAPVWAGSVAALVILPTIAHSAEFVVHHLAGTARLGQSVGASVVFTAVTTLFNTFAMRRGVLVVGADGRSFIDDLRALPGTVLAFVAVVPRAIWSLRRTRAA
jgi:hypothetical protein